MIATIRLLLVLASSMLMSEVTGKPGPDPFETAREQVDPELAGLYKRLFRFLVERDLQLVLNDFCDLEEYRTSHADRGLNQAASIENWTLARDEYLDDYRRLMNQLPKVGKRMSVVSVDTKGMQTQVTASGTTVRGVVLVVNYTSGLAKFEISPPPAYKVKGSARWKFSDRFERLIRFHSRSTELE
ncbi:hypothetical protein HAHE_19280 [Haloferula helveola]|uniref:SnoaL-like domain-containing protein n=1 Tax=Haloferula helveola TaxID=490095 RepID=A0ABM7RK65_9BACT|nr:hypothetical protein HAHE_19280 [Haloferula helveola]